MEKSPTAIAGDRPGDLLPSTVGGSIGGAIDRLLSAAFTGASVNPGRAIAGDGGVLDVPLTTRDPWSDAFRLTSLNWNWLTVNASESIVSVNGAGGSLIFGRTLAQVELVPDLAAIFQSAQKVIVTGARQVPDEITPETIRPTAPRPKFKTTREFRPEGLVFKDLAPSTTSVLAEEKTIIYQYWDDDTWSGYLPLFTNLLLTNFLFSIESVTQSGISIYAPPPPDLNVPMQTITMKRQPAGLVFSDGTDTTLIAAEVLIESNLRKLTLKPAGVLFSDLGADETLVIEKRETLTSAVIPPGAQLTVPRTNASGQAQEYEPRPILEPAQPIPTQPLKTELLKGEANLKRSQILGQRV